MENQREPGIPGRDHVRAQIADALAADRSVLLTGEAGLGKTTVARAAIADAGRIAWRGAGFATLSTLPYTALRVALGSPVAGAPGEVAARVESVVGNDVLLLDDLQWVDRDTMAVVQLLAGRVAMVATARTGDAAFISGPAGAAVVHVRLDPLPAEDAAAIVRRARPDLPPAAVQRVLDRAGGNPLLLEELARDGRESATIARALTSHLARASATARQALGRLAVADRPLPVAAVGTSRAELLDLALVVLTGEEVAIRHALIAEAMLADLGDEERRSAHLEVAAILTADVDVALHLARGGRSAEAVATAIRAAGATSDLRTRAALLRIAAEAATGPGSLAIRAQAAEAALDLDDLDGAATLLDGVRADDPDSEVNARILQLAMSTWDRRGEIPRAEAAWEEARSLPVDPSGRVARVLATDRAVMLANLGRVGEAIALVDAADRADVRREPDNVVARANLCSLLRFFNGEDVPLDDLEAWAEEAVRGRQPGASARVTNVYSVTLAMRGPAAGLAFIDAWAPRLRAVGVDPVRLVAERVQALLFTGRPADAMIAADDLLERPLPTTFVGVTLIARAEACCQMGRFADAEASLRRAEPYITDDWTSRGEALTTAAHVALLAGRPREAIARAESALAVPTHYAGNHQLTALIRAWAQVELGIPPSPLPEATASWVRDAAAAEMAALVIAANGGSAMAAFDDAAAAWDGNLVGRGLVCAWGAGEAARRAGDPSAVDRLRAVLDAAEAGGYEPVAARVRRSLRLAGIRVTRRSTTGADSLLTAREREILDLVAAGHSNIEIARRMGLGRPTVTRMLSNAMAKLGAESRAHAVTLAQRDG